MSDREIYAGLLQQANTLLQESPQLKILLIADENFPESESPALTQFPQISVLTNRYDTAKVFEQHNVDVYFSDFDFEALEQRFDLCIYRVSKERPVVHHIFNSLEQGMNPTYTLLLGGKKNDGIKGYHKKLEKEHGFNGRLIKNGDIYTAALKSGNQTTKILEDKQYPILRKIQLPSSSTELYSKPGVYGWEKEDQGSKLLIDSLLTEEQKQAGDENTRARSLLDLGCGYGYLSILLSQHLQLSKIIATDNNAAAIAACKKNFETYGNPKQNNNWEVVADDCAASVNDYFDLIVCNPPFHQGFDTERELTQKFVAQAAKRLKPSGKAYFVVNSFIPLEKVAAKFFTEIHTCVNDKQFKVIRLST